MSFGLFPYWLKLSLNKIVRDAACTAIPGILVELQGHRPSADGDHEEWVRVNVLSSASESGRSGEWLGDFTLQVSCFSRYGEDRTDRKTNRPSEIAGLISAAISKQNHTVKNYDDDNPVEKGLIYIGKPSQFYLDEGELAQNASQGGVASNIHAEILTWNGQAAL